MVHSLLQFSERYSCHISSVGKIKFASLMANSGGTLYSIPFLFFALPLSGRSPPDMTEILLTGTLSLNHSVTNIKNCNMKH